MDNSSIQLVDPRHVEESQLDHFKKVKTLGSGAFGRVDLYTVEEEKIYARKGDEVAIKMFKKIFDVSMAEEEAELLKDLCHVNVVRFLDSFEDMKEKYCLVMEYCDQGTLEEYLFLYQVSIPKPHPEFNIWRFVCQLSKAISFLHSQDPPILHNDLKPANILCKSEPNPKEDGKLDVIIKIADFGLCNVLDQTPSAMYSHSSKVRGGTECYLAPEVLKDEDIRSITTSADMWSCGALIAFLANDGEHLFRNQWKVFSWTGLESPMKREFKYPELHSLVLSLLSIDKDSRPSAEFFLDYVTGERIDYQYPDSY